MSLNDFLMVYTQGFILPCLLMFRPHPLFAIGTASVGVVVVNSYPNHGFFLFETQSPKTRSKAFSQPIPKQHQLGVAATAMCHSCFQSRATRLYALLCWSVRQSVRPSVGLSIGPSVRFSL